MGIKTKANLNPNLMNSDEKQNQDRVLVISPAQDKAQNTEGLLIYEYIERFDLQVRTVLQTRRAKVKALTYQIHTPDVEEADKLKEITAFIKRNLFEILNFDDILSKALLAQQYGFVVFEKVYQNRDSSWILSQLVYRKPIWFHFTNDGKIIFKIGRASCRERV